MTNPLIATDAQFLDAILEFTATHGYPPTNRELAAVLGYSVRGEGGGVSMVSYRLHRLAEAGRVTMVEGKARTLRVVEPAS